MRLVLVNPPKTAYERSEIAPPLGLLMLAQTAQEAGFSVAIEDFNLLHHLVPELRSNFYEVALRRLLALNADIYGFTSMAVDSHVCLELARQIKEVRPYSLTILGGPHFSSLAATLKSRYPWIDYLFPGAATEQFGQLLRSRHGKIPASRMTKPSRFKMSYGLVQLPAYFHVNPRRVFNMEVNRGCRYKCAFCYSPKFHGKMRDFEIDPILDELSLLASLGAKHVFLVGDNFLNDGEWAKRLCMEIEAARLRLHWHCYVTLPDLDKDIIERMGRAGCKEVFMGIDAVGNASERYFHKAFLRRDSGLGYSIRALRDAGVENVTCGFILCPPSHPSAADWPITVQTAIRARQSGAKVLFNVLNLYLGTEIYRDVSVTHEADPLQCKLLLDVPPVVQENEYARSDPGSFPFHSRYVPDQEWKDFIYMAHCLHTLVNSFPEGLAEVWERAHLSPFQVASKVLKRVGDILSLQALERRQIEQTVGLAILQGLQVERDGRAPFVTDSSAGQGFW